MRGSVRGCTQPSGRTGSSAGGAGGAARAETCDLTAVRMSPAADPRLLEVFYSDTPSVILLSFLLASPPAAFPVMHGILYSADGWRWRYLGTHLGRPKEPLPPTPLVHHIQRALLH